MVVGQYCRGWGTEKTVLSLLRILATTTNAELRNQALITIKKVMAGTPGPRYHKNSPPISLIVGSLRYIVLLHPIQPCLPELLPNRGICLMFGCRLWYARPALTRRTCAARNSKHALANIWSSPCPCCQSRWLATRQPRMR